MTRKDYEATARVIRRNLERALGRESRVAEIVAIQDIARDMAGVFLEDNPRFTVAKFFHACGLNGDGMAVYSAK